MKANEFVKKQGLAEAKRVLHDGHGCVGVKLWGRYEFSTDDLKRLVESHELANRIGGVDTMRIMIEQMEINDLCDGMNISFDGEWQGVFTKSQLQQAIADVESCL